MVPNGIVNFHRVCAILFNFKANYLTQYLHKIEHFKLNLKRPEQIEKEQLIRNLVQNFCALSPLQQKNIVNLVNLMKKFSLYREDAEYFHDNFDSAESAPDVIPETESDIEREPLTDQTFSSFTSLLYMSNEFTQE